MPTRQVNKDQQRPTKRSINTRFIEIEVELNFFVMKVSPIEVATKVITHRIRHVASDPVSWKMGKRKLRCLHCIKKSQKYNYQIDQNLRRNRHLDDGQDKVDRGRTLQGSGVRGGRLCRWGSNHLGQECSVGCPTLHLFSKIGTFGKSDRFRTKKMAFRVAKSKF